MSLSLVLGKLRTYELGHGDVEHLEHGVGAALGAKHREKGLALLGRQVELINLFQGALSLALHRAEI